MVDIPNVEFLVEEYRGLLISTDTKKADSNRELDIHEASETLTREAEWSEAGARHLVQLAREYGVFMLRNALALAIALGIEDGDLGL